MVSIVHIEGVSSFYDPCIDISNINGIRLVTIDDEIYNISPYMIDNDYWRQPKSPDSYTSYYNNIFKK